MFFGGFQVKDLIGQTGLVIIMQPRYKYKTVSIIKDF